MNLFNPAHSLPDLGVGQMYGEVAEYTKEGDFWKFIWGNVTLGQKASLFWAIGAGRFLQTAGLFLLGMLIGRKQLFVASEATIRFWVKALIWSAVLFGPLYQLKVQLMDAGQPDMIRQTVGVVMDMWQKFAFTIVLVASFVLLYQTEKFRKLTADLRFYGNDESDELHLPVYCRSYYLFPVRAVSGPLLRLYRQPADRLCILPFAGSFL